MSYGLCIAGFPIVVGGPMYAAALLQVLPRWSAADTIVPRGIAVLTGVKATRDRDPGT